MQVMYSEGHGTTHNSAYPNRLGEIVQDLKDFGQQGDLPQEFQLNQHLVPCTELQMEWSSCTESFFQISEDSQLVLRQNHSKKNTQFSS